MIPRILIAALAFGLTTSTAQAQWRYEFRGSHTDGDSQQNFDFSFDLIRSDPITAAFSGMGENCSVLPAVVGTQEWSCDGQGFDPNGFETGFNLIDFKYRYTDPTNGDGSGGWFYFFDANAFTQAGTYLAKRDYLTGGDDGQSGYSSAGDATLTVFNDATVVPEPTTWLLLASGLVAVGFIQRRRQRHC